MGRLCTQGELPQTLTQTAPGADEGIGVKRLGKQLLSEKIPPNGRESGI